MTQYDTCSKNLNQMRLNNCEQTALATLCNNNKYGLPKPLQKIVVDMCSDHKIQELAREWQVGECIVNNPNIPNKAAKLILEYVFDTIESNRLNIQIFYNQCRLGGTLRGNFGIPANCSLEINYGNETFEEPNKVLKNVEKL